jgi:hypothetical protein
VDEHPVRMSTQKFARFTNCSALMSEQRVSSGYIDRGRLGLGLLGWLC